MNANRNAAGNGLRNPIAVAVAATMLAQAPLAGAAMFKELSEEALAEMRGKFVVGQQIQYFGMSVSTHWTRTDVVADTGAQHDVSLSLEVDNSGSGTQVSYAVGGTLGDEVANTSAPAPNAALSQIDGAVQVIQVEGSDNLVRNNVGYAVIPADAAPTLDGAQMAAALPAGQTFRNGDVVTHFTTAGGVGFTITAQGNQVTQRLGANAGTGHNQLLQAVRLQGDGHRIVNDLMIQVAFENALSQRGDGLRFRADRIVNML